jgi:ABC-type branched-subunit amino acid transport system permease subunit
VSVQPPRPPDEPPGTEGPRVGVDEWVARHEERRGARTGWTAPLLNAFERLPPWAVLAIGLAAGAAVPFLSDSDYVVRVAVNTVLFALLAVGLNVVVGWSGLLDLGFVAFYGFGAYLYAMLSSEQFGVHLPAELAIPAVIVTSALLGLLLGLPSRRLLGDYLAIVTLFFAQIFVVLILAVLALTELRGLWRTLLLVPTLYLAAFVWENRLVEEPSVTRILLLGALLIALMTWRPQGLLGTSRVEIA